MINPAELRIGNWLSNGEKNYTIDISSLYDIATGITNEIWEPILLTEEILFKIDNCRNIGPFWAIRWGVKMDKIIRWDDQHKCLVMSLGMGKEIKVNHLHTLQNIFYFLTEGEELNINL